MSKNICRVCPAIVARYPEILQLAKPRCISQYPIEDFAKRRRQITAIVQEKLLSL